MYLLSPDSVCSVKDVIRKYPTLSKISYFTDWILIMSRIIFISKGSTPSREIVIVIGSPLSPRIRSTDSLRDKPKTGVSSICIIKSPAKTPAL